MTKSSDCAPNFIGDLFFASPPSGWTSFLGILTVDQWIELEADFRSYSAPAQKPPPGDWLIWLFLGGRGAGKTRAGAEWVNQQVRAGVGRVALVGPTFNDVREVMIDGPSGLSRTGPAEHRPRFEVSRRRLIWPNGAEGYAFSAEDPDGLRGPQFELAWGDEFAAWSEPQKVLDTLRMGLRLGAAPRLMLSTTPRPIPALKALMAGRGVISTHQPTSGNAANLSPGFMAAMQAAYGDSVLGRQELGGELIEDPDGALWRRADIEAVITDTVPDLDRIIVAIDPPASGGPRADECGIVIAGACGEGASRRAWVLADRSFGPAMPADWARVAAESFDAFEADGLVAEANQGGEMVRSVLRAACSSLPIRLVHASRGKHVRAEPVAALYAAGRVRHAGHFAALEDQMCAFGAPGAPKSSPDRVDALVWALTDLLLAAPGAPRLRRI